MKEADYSVDEVELYNDPGDGERGTTQTGVRGGETVPPSNAKLSSIFLPERSRSTRSRGGATAKSETDCIRFKCRSLQHID